MSTKNFIILGMGFVSKRHLEAIKAVGGNLLAYHDTHDGVGHVDAYFINALYYPEFIHFNLFIDRYLQSDNMIDYAVVLLPNHLHNPACRWAMKMGMDVICEKPLVLYEKNLDELAETESRTGRKVNTILQMRLHDEAARLRYDIDSSGSRFHEAKIIYNTPRGHWFRHDGGWKSDPKRSGGLFMAIGVHIADFLSTIFGKHVCSTVDHVNNETISGRILFERGNISFILSVSPSLKSERIFTVDGNIYDFTNGFMDLHVKSYERIISGEGFGIKDAREGIRICEEIRRLS